MNMITIQWEIPEEMKPYIDSTNKLRQNAIRACEKISVN